MNRERHSMGGMAMSAAVLGGLVGAAGGYGDAALCGTARERTTHLALKQPQQQQQEMAQAAAAQLTADEQRRQQQQQQVEAQRKSGERQKQPRRSHGGKLVAKGAFFNQSNL